jgi:hypothetical protein
MIGQRPCEVADQSKQGCLGRDDTQPILSEASGRLGILGWFQVLHARKLNICFGKQGSQTEPLQQDIAYLQGDVRFSLAKYMYATWADVASSISHLQGSFDYLHQIQDSCAAELGLPRSMVEVVEPSVVVNEYADFKASTINGTALNGGSTWLG